MIIYDIKSGYNILVGARPLTMQEIYEISEQTNFIIWNSENGGAEPKVVDNADGKIVIDITTERGKEILAQIERNGTLP